MNTREFPLGTVKSIEDVNRVLRDIERYFEEVNRKQMSITLDDTGSMLVNDQELPGVNKVYGTDGSGVKGWR